LAVGVLPSGQIRQRGGFPLAKVPSAHRHLLGGVPVVPGGHGTSGGGHLGGFPMANWPFGHTQPPPTTGLEPRGQISIVLHFGGVPVGFDPSVQKHWSGGVPLEPAGHVWIIFSPHDDPFHGWPSGQQPPPGVRWSTGQTGWVVQADAGSLAVAEA